MSETPTHFIAVCPHCLVGLKVPSEYSGQNVRCKHCDQKFRALSPDFPLTPGSSDYSAAAVSVPGSGSDRLAVNCPNCGTGLSVRRAYAGQHVRCGQCGQKFPVSRSGRCRGERRVGSLQSALQHPRGTSVRRGIDPSDRPGGRVRGTARGDQRRTRSVAGRAGAPASGPKDVRGRTRAGPGRARAPERGPDPGEGETEPAPGRAGPDPRGLRGHPERARLAPGRGRRPSQSSANPRIRAILARGARPDLDAARRGAPHRPPRDRRDEGEGRAARADPGKCPRRTRGRVA